jgi:non-heme chloroperoxidase
MRAGRKAAVEGVKAFLEADFTADLRSIDVPTLILHGGDDQVVPLDASALRSTELLRDADYRVYEGAPHGICSTHKGRVKVGLIWSLQMALARTRDKSTFKGQLI